MNKSISRNRRNLLALALTTLLVTGCSTLQRSGDTSGKNARQLSEQGDHVASSRAYLELAAAVSGNQQERYVIFAANELFLANDLGGADRILQEIGERSADANLDLWAQVTAELRLAEGDPAAALSTLNEITSTENETTAKRILLLRSDALFKLGRAETAVATLLQREAMLTKSKDIRTNHRYIWTGLQDAGGSIPADIGQRWGDPVLNGWLELGYISYSNRSSLTSLNLGLTQWRDAHPEHPASGELLDEVLEGLSSLSNYPDHVGLMLPLSGKQQALGAAIRDGFLAAHFSLGNDSLRPDIRIYDTARTSVTAAYQQAVINGANFLVGPLLKSEVGELADLADDIPTLALNYGPPDLDYPELFYQFALAPEDEARAVANRATDEGRYNAVALVPESPWGDRVLTAFQDQLELRGGKLLAARTYQADSADYAEIIREVLLLDESYARRNRLSANIGKQLEFRPRRRQDVDLIFIGAGPTKAKQLRPQLRFHYAADIPTYSTSAVYAPGSTDNADINGVIFPDMPWLLRPTQMVRYDQTIFAEYWGSGSAQLARFYAMGYDAYHLTAVINSAKTVHSARMEGMTGNIYLERNGRLHRTFAWAKMERGKPRALPDSQRGLTEDIELVIR
jgi:hypothetical protein